MKKWLKKLIFIGLVLFFSYLVYLNYLIKSTFSSEVQKSDQITQIDYSIKRYPKEMVNMILLVEDQSFFQHWGVDFKEIVRVFYGYLFEDKDIRGASTITQQLIKNTLLSRDKTLSRKIDEALMAMLMELNYDKNYIICLYFLHRHPIFREVGDLLSKTNLVNSRIGLVFFVFDENISCHFKQMILTAIETAISQGFFKLITNLMK